MTPTHPDAVQDHSNNGGPALLRGRLPRAVKIAAPVLGHLHVFEPTNETGLLDVNMAGGFTGAAAILRELNLAFEKGVLTPCSL
jgi:hypothetical protein